MSDSLNWNKFWRDLLVPRSRMIVRMVRRRMRMFGPLQAAVSRQRRLARGRRNAPSRDDHSKDDFVVKTILRVEAKSGYAKLQNASSAASIGLAADLTI